MSSSGRFPVVLLWHMHQPQYRDALSGQYVLPWTYLHAIKDYVDMAAHLEAHPAARAVVNFTPVLIEQLQELATRIGAHLSHGEALPDPILTLLSEAPLPVGVEARFELLQSCLRAEPTHLIGRYPAYARLAARVAELAALNPVGIVEDQFLRDVAVWYHLAWLGETVKRGDARVAMLMAQEQDFSAAQRRTLLSLIGGLIAGVLPRYRALSEAGRVELAMSPYSHPILPLLYDFATAREATPDAPLPHAARYPGGAERAIWQMREGLRVFRDAFGVTPAGCWPSEGAISTAAVELIEASGFRWLASSATVLRGCLAGQSQPVEPTRPYRLPGKQLCCFFRDDGLSDLIGFTYSKWHGDQAVANLVGELEAIARHEQGKDGRLALIAMDGENAWEHFPFNGYYFLNALYAVLADHPTLELTTLSAVLDRNPPTATLPHVVAGSWVHGTLSTWIGSHDKNAGWDLLVQAKDAVDRVLATRALDAPARERVARQLALCESSDWFWWFGDYNPAKAVQEFDLLYRHQLTSLYRMLELPVPPQLSVPISQGRGTPEGGGVMRRANQ
jgi:alpha-amylase/alpha-mannosidase (GH57 family)